MIDGGLSGRLRETYARMGRLLKIHMDLLYACDLDCRHCYLEDKKRSQVGTEAIVDVLRQAADLGAMQALFSGGEIFLRKDLFDILEAARDLRYFIRLKTHGGHITAEHAARLRELGVGRVDFSVYALDEEVHDAFTKRAGSLANTLRGIDLLVDAGLAVEVNCVVTNVNRLHYRKLHEHFTARGIQTNLQGRVRGTNSLGLGTYPLNLSYEDKVQLELFRVEHRGGPQQRREPPPPEQSKFCYAGRTSLYVAPDLKVYPCSAFPMQCGDLTRQPLRAIWTGAPELDEVRAATRADTKGCGTCAARKQCSYCPGAAYIESGGDWRKQPEVICQGSFAIKEAEERYRAGERPRPHKPVHFPILGQTRLSTPPPSAGAGPVCRNC